MSALEVALRIGIALARHPVVQAGAKRLLRDATAEMLRQVRHRTRAGVAHHSIS